MSEAKQVPLIERLRSVPSKAVLRIDTPVAPFVSETRSIPVGPLCHEAADTLSRPTSDEARDALAELVATFIGKRDAAYCRYIGDLRKSECLGWKQKIKSGQFGEAELKTHTLAAERLGLHRAFAAALEDVQSVLAAPAQAESHPAAPQGDDTQRMDFIEQRCVELLPEYEGPWSAYVYEDGDVATIKTEGKTAREAIDAARSAHLGLVVKEKK